MSTTTWANDSPDQSNELFQYSGDSYERRQLNLTLKNTHAC